MTALLGRWNHARTGKHQRGASGWWRGRTKLVYVHLTEAEWTAVDEAARAEGLTRERWLVRLVQQAPPSAVVVAERAAEAASAARLRARREDRRTREAEDERDTRTVAE